MGTASIQQGTFTGFNSGDSFYLTCDQVTSSGSPATWNGLSPNTDGSTIASIISSLSLGTATVTWPNSSDGGLTDYGSPPLAQIAFDLVGGVGYDQPPMIFTDSTTTSVVTCSVTQHGDVPANELHWLSGSSQPWESMNWYHGPLGTQFAPSYPGSDTSFSTWRVYVSDNGAAGNVPQAPVSSVSCSIFDSQAVTGTSSYGIGSNVAIAGSGILNIGYSGNTTSVHLWTGTLGSSNVVTLRGGGQLNWNSGSALTINGHDSSIIFAFNGGSSTSVSLGDSSTVVMLDGSAQIVGSIGGSSGTNTTYTMQSLTLAGSSALQVIAGGSGSTNTLTINAPVVFNGNSRCNVADGGGNNAITFNSTVTWNSNYTTQGFGYCTNTNGCILTFDNNITIQQPIIIGDGSTSLQTSGKINLIPSALTATWEIKIPSGNGGSADFGVDYSNIPANAVTTNNDMSGGMG